MLDILKEQGITKGPFVGRLARYQRSAQRFAAQQLLARMVLAFFTVAEDRSIAQCTGSKFHTTLEPADGLLSSQGVDHRVDQSVIFEDFIGGACVAQASLGFFLVEGG